MKSSVSTVFAVFAVAAVVAPSAAHAAEHLRFDFEGVSDPVGLVEDTSASGNDGMAWNNGMPNAALRAISSGGSGQAVAFPAACPNTDSTCPRAIITVPDHPGLNPGMADFSYGVRVRVMPGQLTADHGSNLLQKGKWNTSQWKVQLDDAVQGRPSCVLRPTVDPENSTVKVRASVGIADGVWHEVTCVRAGGTLSILVDGVARGSKPFTEAVSPEGEELTVGGSGTFLKNDQFHGELDAVHFDVAEAPSMVGVVYDFEDVVSPILTVTDGSGGGHHGDVEANANPGAVLTPVAGSLGGTAIAFPASCPNADSTCPRVRIAAADHPDLNPGSRDFAFGVRLRVTPSQISTDHGSNLLQKGLYTTSQWKLQLDHTTGRPSCVLRPSDDPGQAVTVKAAAGIADGQWHELICRRQGSTLTLYVDGVASNSKAFSGEVAPVGEALTIGGVGTYLSNSQFHGALDHAWFELLP